MIRDLTKADVPSIITLGSAMSAETSLGRFRINVPRAEFILSDILETDKVFAQGAFKDGTLVAMVIGEVAEHPFINVVFAQDLFIYAHPDHRGGTAIPRMIKAFETWALANRVDYIKLEISAGINNDRATTLFNKLGYTTDGSVLLKGAA